MRLAPVLPFALLVGCQAPAAGSAPAFARAVQGFEIRQSSLAVEGGAGRLIVVQIPGSATIEVLPVQSPASLQSIAGLPGDRPCVAINGGFYDDGGAMGWVVHAGEEAAQLRPGGGSGVLALADGRWRIVHRDRAGGRPREALQSIDRLVDGGRSLVGPQARPDPDARSAVALRSDGAMFFAVLFAERAIAREHAGRVELGSASSSTGLSLAAWADLLARPVAEGGLGATTALNLDGGYSTSLSIHAGELDLEVVAYRATINAIRACAGPATTPNAT